MKTVSSGGHGYARLFVRRDGTVVAIGTGGVIQRISPEGGIVDQRSSWSAFGLDEEMTTHSHVDGIIDSHGRIVVSTVLRQRHGSRDRSPVFKYVVERVFADQVGFPDDPSFAPIELIGGQANSISELPDAGYAIVGNFAQTVAHGITKSATKAALVAYDGSVVPAFDVRDGPSAAGLAELLPAAERGGVSEWKFVTNSLNNVWTGGSGSIWVFGGFQSWSGVNASQLMKLDSNGGMAADFEPFHTTTGSDLVGAAKLLTTGNMLVCQGVEGNHPLRLMKPDGTLESAFNVTDGTVSSPFIDAVEQADGRIIMIFGRENTRSIDTTTDVLGTTISKYARIHPDGTFDAGFDASQYLGIPNCLAYDPRGYVYMGIGPTVIRVFATAADITSLSAEFRGAGQLRLRLVGPPGRASTVEESSDLVVWRVWTNIVTEAMTTDLLKPVSDETGSFFRARTH